MKSKFKFDSKTGTMVPDSPIVPEKPVDDVQEMKGGMMPERPEFEEEKKLDVKSDAPNVMQNQVLQMVRVNRPTAIQLLDARGLPEAYLDSATTGVLMFRERQDYDIYQIVDERTNKPLAYIGGYALQINFNMAELKSMERVEQCLTGLNKLFRKFIMEQALKR